jgi:hypothetical protein
MNEMPLRIIGPASKTAEIIKTVSADERALVERAIRFLRVSKEPLPP